MQITQSGLSLPQTSGTGLGSGINSNTGSVDRRTAADTPVSGITASASGGQGQARNAIQQSSITEEQRGNTPRGARDTGEEFPGLNTAIRDAENGRTIPKGSFLNIRV